MFLFFLYDRCVLLLQVAVVAGKERRKTRRQRAAILHLQYLRTGPGAEEKQQTAAAPQRWRRWYV